MNNADMEKRRRQLQEQSDKQDQAGPCPDCSHKGLRALFVDMYWPEEDGKEPESPCQTCVDRAEKAGLNPLVFPGPMPAGFRTYADKVRNGDE